MALACLRCGTAPRRNSHPNTKYCDPCRLALLRVPASGLTATQGAAIEALRGTMFRWQIAERVGISTAGVTRYLREQRLTSNARNYPQDVVTAVCTAYQTLGKRKTQDLFPDVNVRSIVERYKQYSPRQIRWRDEQQLEAIRMAGLVSATGQAQYFDRPNAFEGSIKSFWVKTVKCAPTDVNGLAAQWAWQLATPGVPAILIKHQVTAGARPYVLWLDLAQHLRPDCHPNLRHAVETLARFQRWLHGTDNPADIRRMIQEREAYG